MATWSHVSTIASGLPETIELPLPEDAPAWVGAAQWRVKNKLFAWGRRLRAADHEALGETAPDGPILAASVADLGVKEALLADDPEVYFTTPHFDGYKAVLVRLPAITVPDLEELLVEAWLARAPKRLATAFLAASRPQST